MINLPNKRLVVSANFVPGKVGPSTTKRAAADIKPRKNKAAETGGLSIFDDALCR
jgi:hypothetical protein